jgi:16S rRNA processing protein RimM
LTAGAPAELRIGRVIKAHGVKGAVRVELLTDFPDRFTTGRAVDIAGRPFTVKDAREQDGGLLVSFEGIDDRDAADALRGAYITLPLSAARSLPEDHYYHFQLVGLSVFDIRQQRTIGRVAEVLSYAANDVLRVTDGQREVLIPMLKAVVQAIKRDEELIVVDLPQEIDA